MVGNGLKSLDLDRLKPLAGFTPIDETQLANVKLRLADGRQLSATDLRRSFAILSRARGAVQELKRLPDPNEAIHCILNGDARQDTSDAHR